MSGTDVAYAAPPELKASYSDPPPILVQAPGLRDAQYRRGTDLAYAAMLHMVLTTRMLLPGQGASPN
eukprot:2572640-Rhodomonas_salina.1